MSELDYSIWKMDLWTTNYLAGARSKSDKRLKGILVKELFTSKMWEGWKLEKSLASRKEKEQVNS